MQYMMHGTLQQRFHLLYNAPHVTLRPGSKLADKSCRNKAQRLTANEKNNNRNWLLGSVEPFYAMSCGIGHRQE